MNKFLFFILFFFTILTFFTARTDYVDISHTATLSSIAFSYDEENEEISLTTYLLNNYTLSKSSFSASTDRVNATIYTTTAQSIKDVFFNFVKAANITIDFSHIESLILHESFLHEELLKGLIEYFETSIHFYPSFKIFITKDLISSLYNIESLADNSSYFTILTNEQNEINYHYQTVIALINYMKEQNYSCIIPSIALVENTKSNLNGVSLYIDGYYYLGKGYNYFHLPFDTYPLLSLLYSTNSILLHFKENETYIKKYHNFILKFNHKMKIFYFIKTNDQNTYFDDYQEFIKSMYAEGFDLLNIDYYNILIDNVSFILI